MSVPQGSEVDKLNGQIGRVLLDVVTAKSSSNPFTSYLNAQIASRRRPKRTPGPDRDVFPDLRSPQNHRVDVDIELWLAKIHLVQSDVIDEVSFIVTQPKKGGPFFAFFCADANMMTGPNGFLPKPPTIFVFHQFGRGWRRRKRSQRSLI